MPTNVENNFGHARSGTILKIEFRNVVGELVVVLNREFQVPVGVRFCIEGRRVFSTTGHFQALTSRERRGPLTLACRETCRKHLFTSFSVETHQSRHYVVASTLAAPLLVGMSRSTVGSGTREDNVTKPDEMRVDVGSCFAAKSINELGKDNFSSVFNGASTTINMLNVADIFSLAIL